MNRSHSSPQHTDRKLSQFQNRNKMSEKVENKKKKKANNSYGWLVAVSVQTGETLNRTRFGKVTAKCRHTNENSAIFCTAQKLTPAVPKRRRQSSYVFVRPKLGKKRPTPAKYPHKQLRGQMGVSVCVCVRACTLSTDQNNARLIRRFACK